MSKRTYLEVYTELVRMDEQIQSSRALIRGHQIMLEVREAQQARLCDELIAFAGERPMPIYDELPDDDTPEVDCT